MYSKFRVSANRNINVFSEAFRLYFSNFGFFLSVILPPTIFISLAILLDAMVSSGAEEAVGLQFMFLNILHLFAVIYTYMAAAYASVFIVTEQTATVSQVYNLISFRKIGLLLLAVFLKSIIIGFGFLFFIIPGLYFMISFIFVELVVIFEGKGVRDSLSRSRQIIMSDFWGFVSVIVPFLLLFVVLVVLYQLGFVALISLLSGRFQPPEATGVYALVEILLAGGNGLPRSIVMISNIVLGNILIPLNLTFMSMVYLVYRINEEGLTKEQFLLRLGV